MSNNFHIEATRQVQVLKTGKIETQRQYLEVWQTPTKETDVIMSADNPLQAYFDWVLSISEDEIVLIYADDDIFQKNGPIGREVQNMGEDHVEEMKMIVKELESEGYELTYEAW